jgi:cytochrome c-type biogenesis protein CcmH/NrfF
VLWILPLALLVAGLVTLTVLANRVRRELSPTVAVVDRFGREHRVELTKALERLRAETEHTHRRLSSD